MQRIATMLALAGAVTAQQPLPDPSVRTEPRAASQASTAPVPSLQELIANVRKAHVLVEKAPEIETLQTQVNVTNLEKGSVELTIAVRWKKGGLLRYEVIGGETKKEQGIDEEGEWEAVGKHVADLREARSDAGLLQVQQNLRICDQLVRFLDPTRLLEELRGKGPPRRETVALSSTEHGVRCLVVAGIASSFPLLQKPPDAASGGVRCELYVSEKDWKLRAVRATPLDDQARARGTGEWIVLQDLSEQDGLWLPRRLVVYEPGPKGPVPLVRIQVESIRWNLPLSAWTFRRPR